MRPEEVHALAVAAGLTHERAIIATAIAWAESGLNPAAVGDVDLADDVYGASAGLWQVRSLHADTGTGRPRDIERLGEPAFNARAMVTISNGGTNWQPWSVWKTGRYLTHIDAVRAAVGGTVAVVRGGTVRPHVQAFANACNRATGADSFGTYPGHDPSIDLALDIFHAIGDDELADAVCDFALENLERFGVDYVISRQRIYNPEIATYWRNMEDRGSPTQNHRDHVHVSFEPTAPDLPDDPLPEPTPDPVPVPEEDEDDMPKLIGVTNNRGIFLVGTTPLGTKASKGRIPARYIPTPDEVTALVEAKVATRDESAPDLPEALFNKLYIVVG